MLIPLPFHGQSSTDCVGVVFAEPSVLAATGKYPLDRTRAFMILMHSERVKHHGFRRYGLHIVSLDMPGVTVPNVGLVISSAVQRCVSTDIRTGSTVNALQTLSKAQLFSN